MYYVTYYLANYDSEANYSTEQPLHLGTSHFGDLYYN